MHSSSTVYKQKAAQNISKQILSVDFDVRELQGMDFKWKK